MPNQEEINLDNVLNSGVDSNSNLDDAPKVDANGNPIDTTVSSNDKPENVDSPTDETADETAVETPEESKAKVNNLLKSFAGEVEGSQKENKQGLLTKFGGSSFDNNGNILDAEGNIKTPFEDIYKYLSDDTVTTDDKGNQVDAEGNITKTAYELAVETTVVNKLHDESEFTFEDENGNPKIYSDDDKGIAEFTKDVSATRFEEFKEEFFGQNKVLTEVAKHLLAGNDIDTFRKDIDYSAIDDSKMTKESKQAEIKRSFVESGLNEATADSMLEVIINSNQVDSQYLKAKETNEANQLKRNEQRDAQYQASVDAQNARVEQYWDDVKQVVDKGVLKDISIPEEDRAKFYTYMSAVVDDKGNSQDMIDAQKEDKEQKLMSAYWRFKGYDLSKLVKKEANNVRVNSLKDRIKRSANVKNNPINDANKGGTSGEADITISSLLG